MTTLKQATAIPSDHFAGGANLSAGSDQGNADVGHLGEILENMRQDIDAINDEVGTLGGGGSTGFDAETASVGGKIELYEATANGTNKVTMQSPAALSSDRTITVPDANVDLTKVNMLTGAGAGQVAKLELAEDTDNGANKATIQPVAQLTGDRTVTIPDADVDLSKVNMLTKAASAQVAKLELAEDTDNGASKVTVQPEAQLTGDRTLTLPDRDVHLGVALQENVDGEMGVSVLHGVASSGTWTPSMTANGPQLQRTPAATTDDWWVHVPLPNRTLAGVGRKPTGIHANYKVNTAALDDFRLELYKVTMSADGSDSARALLGGDQDAHYDAAHNTAGGRGDNTAGPELHRIEMTLPTPAYLAENEQLWLRIVADGDAGGAAALDVTAVKVKYSETLLNAA